MERVDPAPAEAPAAADLDVAGPEPIEIAAIEPGLRNADPPAEEPVAAVAAVEEDEGPAPPADPVAEQRAEAWAEAGALAARLSGEIPCGVFALSADADGAPFLTAEVPSRRDIGLVRPAIAGVMDDAFDVTVGLGCTADLGGGYLALSDEGETARLLLAEELTSQIRAVLPGRILCDGLGLVAEASRRFSSRLADAGTPSVWVLDAGAPLICQQAEGGWRVRDAPDGVRAGVVLFSGDVLMAEASRGAEIVASVATPTGPPPEPRLAPPSPDEGVEAPRAIDVADPPDAGVAPAEQSDDLFDQTPRSVTPISGPSPSDVAGVSGSRSVAVDISFSVDERGGASDFVVIGAETFDPVVVASAVRIVEESRFPPAQSGGGYRGQYRVVLGGGGAAASSPAITPSLTTPEPSAPTPLSPAPIPEARDRQPSRGDVIWVRGPSVDDFDEVYPEQARRRGRGGEARLTCVILSSGALDCAIESESPSGLRFGAAALALADRLIAAPRLSDGSPSDGHRFAFPISFAIEDEIRTPRQSRTDEAPQARAAQPSATGSVLWQRPLRAQDFDDLYPPRARAFAREGSAQLSCIVLTTRRLRCALESEAPRGWRFGRAALQLSERLIAAPVLSNGQPSAGHAFTLPFAFQLGG